MNMTADELRAISRKLSAYLELHPNDKDARSMADRWGRSLHCSRQHQPISAASERPAVLEFGRQSTAHNFWRAGDSTRNTACRHVRLGVVRDGCILVHQHS
jgi:hypothetical protein